jgi:lysophospholipase L1-like esterase
MERSKPVDLSPMTAEEKSIVERFAPTHYEKNLKSLILKCKQDGSVVYLLPLVGLLTYPPTDDELRIMHFPRNLGKKLEVYRAVYDKYVKSVYQVADDTSTPVLDLSEIIKTPDQRKIFTDTMHLNEEGAQAFGVFIARHLRANVEGRLATKSQ